MARTSSVCEPETTNPARCGAGVGILALQGGEDVKSLNTTGAKPMTMEAPTGPAISDSVWRRYQVKPS
jgi:hypothetical protein